MNQSFAQYKPFFRKISFTFVIILFLSFLALGLINPYSASAQLPLVDPTPGPSDAPAPGPALDLGIKQVAAPLGLPATDLRIVVARVIRTALGLLGIVALVIILYAGFVWMTAGGEEEKISEAKKLLYNGLIGLIIILSSYAIASFVISKLVDATTGGGGGPGGEPCVGPQCGGGVFDPGSSLYVKSLPATGSVCIRNVHPVMVFNREVSIDTLTDNIILQDKAGAIILGAWEYGLSKAITSFVPNGSCAPDAGSDCLNPKADYTMTIVKPGAVKSLDGSLSLSCGLGAPSCGPVTFTTGEGVDRLPPTVSMFTPFDSFAMGSVVPVKVDFADDNAVQNISLLQGNKLIDSKTLLGCQNTGAVDFKWPTVGLAAGTYNLKTIGLDFAGNKGTDAKDINLKPPHCFNGQKDADEEGIDCGGADCGACGGGKCTNSKQCASGYCEIPDGAAVGVCVDRMSIQAVSPLSGAIGTYVSVAGFHFGATPGQVFFSKVVKPTPGLDNHWVEAPLVKCGGIFKSWTDQQLLVEVPPGAISGPIKVITAPLKGKDGKSRIFTDLTNDSWGPVIPDFQVNDLVRPGLCGVTPDKGLVNESVVLQGKNFGLLVGNSQVMFGAAKAVINPEAWTDSFINTAVPDSGTGKIGLKVIAKGIESNGLAFTVLPGASVESPLITEILPATGPVGQYLTIHGQHFGNKLGLVWFKKIIGVGTPGPAFNGDFVFPAKCQQALWNDQQVLVKVPSEINDQKDKIGKYYVQIKTADGKVSSLGDSSPGGATFTLTNGNPSPGICEMNPVSGLVPFKDGVTMELVGEYFGDANNTNVYFWRAGAKGGDTTVDRTPVDKIKDIFVVGKNSITLRPPGPPSQVITGPVVATRDDNKVFGDAAKIMISNPLNFSVFDCTKNKPANTCSDVTYTCCQGGAEVGICKPPGKLCTDETKQSGYRWRFSTRDIPTIPRVVERCDAVTEQGAALPSPSPSMLWDVANDKDKDKDHVQQKVCSSALVTVEFTASIAGDTVTPAVVNQGKVVSGSVRVSKCTAVKDNNCDNPENVPLADGSLILHKASGGKNVQTDYLQLRPVGSWDQDRWYQVVLTTDIKSAGKPSASINLAVDKPCSVANSAYCFVFKTDNRPCQLRQVIVTPYAFWTSILEAPIKSRVTGVESDLFYQADALSDQRCIMMDTAGLNWQWKVDQRGGVQYADIYKKIASNVKAQVNSLVNTVGVGLANPDNSTNVDATGDSGATQSTGHSPLTIDLSTPEVIDYWPQCLEACTNAEVGLKFNISLSSRTLPGGAPNGAVRILKCNDENCLSTTEIFDKTRTVSLDVLSKYTILHVANHGLGATPLEPNTLYKIVVSADSKDPSADTKTIWSASTYNDPSKWSKPFAKEFSWRFRTKKTSCVIDRVDITPKIFNAAVFNDRQSYQAQTFSSPDSCKADGQPLNPWTVGWDWKSSDPAVATVQVPPFITRGQNPFCTTACVRKGADIASGVGAVVPTCGDGTGKIYAGEDCASPDLAKGCGLNCLNLGAVPPCGDGKGGLKSGAVCDPSDPKTAIGCSKDCKHLGAKMTTGPQELSASICGSGQVGSGKDCDLAIPEDPKNPQSALGCSNVCLHQGNRLSKKWCDDHSVDKGGFSVDEFTNACSQAISQCGDGIQTPDKDLGCDKGSGQHQDYCDDFCRYNSLKAPAKVCDPAKEGCSGTGQYLGASLNYSTPSICGDGFPVDVAKGIGIGKDPYCETNLTITHADIIDPWTLATGVGLSKNIKLLPAPPHQSTDIIGKVSGVNKNGSGSFVISCGYKSDADCTKIAPDFGLGSDTCCYAHAQLKSTIPESKEPVVGNICPNTYLEARFSKQIDQNSVTGNIIIARGSMSKCQGGNDVSQQVATAQNSTNAGEDSNHSNIRWYHYWWNVVVDLFKKVVVSSATAEVLPKPTFWCSGTDIGNATVINDPDQQTGRIVIKLPTMLATDTNYAIIFKAGVKDTQGVGVSAGLLSKTKWKFNTGSKPCEISSVAVKPAQVSFFKVNATAVLEAQAQSVAGPIQSIPNIYAWDFIWNPVQNPVVTLTKTATAQNTITSQNHNGDVDVTASANLTANLISNKIGPVANGKSRVTVFLCEHPWPPQQVTTLKGDLVPVFPYQDQLDNFDGFDAKSYLFDGTPIPKATVGNGYFHFSTYYCADKNGHSSSDDLPYLRPAVQVNDLDLGKNKNGVCEVTGQTCIGLGGKYECGRQISVGKDQLVLDTLTTGVCGGYSLPDKKSNFFIRAKTGLAIGCSSGGKAGEDTCMGEGDFATWLKNNNLNVACYKIKKERPLSCYKFPPLKRFIFTNEKNNDAIGMQIFSNPAHLTVNEWFESDKKLGGQGFVGVGQAIQVDGYDAMSDGNNVYVDALNYVPDGKNNFLYSNIYSFNINANAQADTQEVFSQLKNNLRFSINSVNNRYCESSFDDFSSQDTPCNSDLDCAVGKICANRTDKLKRNYLRLRQFKLIDQQLENFAASHQGQYPDIKEGSYLAGQTLSVWTSSWIPQLGQVIGLDPDLPVDPINKLAISGTCLVNPSKFCTKDSDCQGEKEEKCTLHESNTGWSDQPTSPQNDDRRFSFACNSASYAYRYIFSNKNGYDFRVHQEDPGILFTNWDDFVLGFHFNKPANVHWDSICNKDQEIATFKKGFCGDGVLNPGEECDPPKSTVYDNSACVLGGNPNIATLKTCSPDCHWVVTNNVSCKDKNVCGNGKIDFGEACDDGLLFNGLYNKCSKQCDGPVAPYNPKDKSLDASPGYCADGNDKRLDKDYKINHKNINPKYEVCHTGTGKDVYNVKKEKSCRWDCQAYGPSCGDGLVQTEYGEDCETDQACTIDGQEGLRRCTKSCVAMTTDKSFVAWWKFDKIFDLVVENGKSLERFNDSGSNQIYAQCELFTKQCPDITNGHTRQGLLFDGLSKSLVVPDQSLLNPTTDLSVEAWIKPEMPDPLNPGRPRVLEKGGYGKGGGYSLQFEYQTRRIGFVVWRKGIYNQWRIVSKKELPNNEWTHVIGTYQKIGTKQTIQLYINGTVIADDDATILVSGNPPQEDSLSETKAASTIDSNVSYLQASKGQPLFIGRASQDGEYFKGIIDEVKLYDRVLSPGEVKDHFNNNWTCEIKPADELAASTKGKCGDGRMDPKLDAWKACDNGAKNGLACTPSYGLSCSYCSADCLNVIHVQPNGYCGDGIIQATENCEADPKTGTLYMSATASKLDLPSVFGDILGTTLPGPDGTVITTPFVDNFKKDHNGYEVRACNQETLSPGTYKKGTKQCVNKCSKVTIQETGQSSCILCGLTTPVNGVEAGGSVINVLDPASPPFKGAEANNFDLYLDSAEKPGIIPVAYSYGIITDGIKKINYLLNKAGPQFPPDDSQRAYLATAAECSVGPEPHYRLWTNTSVITGPDKLHPFDFPVVAKPKLGQYDLLLSPVISTQDVTHRLDPAKPEQKTEPKSARPNDIRVVVSWTGGDNFFSGFIVPADDPKKVPQITYEGTSADFKPLATGYDYYNKKFAAGIWYHGFGETVGQTHEEAFTISTNDINLDANKFFTIPGMTAPVYAFYVRIPDGGGSIANRTLSDLKVQVYFPENDNILYHFANPVQTFYLSGAALSNNPAAYYWQVFNIINSSVPVGADVKNRVRKVQKIRTGPANFDYSVNPI